MELLKFELYKIFKQKSIWITFIFMLGMSYLSLAYPYSSAVEKDMYQDWEGSITDEDIQEAKIEYASLIEKEKQQVDDEKDALTDQETMQLWMYQKLVLSEVVMEGNEQRIQELRKEITAAAEMEMAMREEISMNQFSHQTGPTQTVAFVEFGAFLVLGVMLILGLSPIYSKEYSSKMDHYLFSSKKGRKPLAKAKIVAALIYTCLVVLSWEAFNLVLNFILHGNEGWGMPIQFYTLYLNPAYAESPYAFTMLEYHFIQLGIHLLAGCSFALLIVWISSLCHNALITFFISASIYIAPELLGMAESLQTLLTFSYISTVRVQILFTDFKAIDLFGYPVLYPIVACLVMIIAGFLCILATLHNIKNREIGT
ncbi:ABC-type transport system involved in multi-copper enzyme maturation permease subunit [Bacillus mesophilus]|uniref:ABC transporter permease subunit n=1 Tax=Bacillus mesophilus TaxID=1808955 RepID=A0A6M0Q3R2_9BACI|nr:hypothetical protein [Bacillus mesophilus]MBM7660266.1 ABC-type transport system involved in multi-copper enzyme maturation permease subunit [Bacillus mesophilus]NEY70981.1 hypothetical protein [Bacillus mesophilus]